MQYLHWLLLYGRMHMKWVDSWYLVRTYLAKFMVPQRVFRIVCSAFLGSTLHFYPWQSVLFLLRLLPWFPWFYSATSQQDPPAQNSKFPRNIYVWREKGKWCHIVLLILLLSLANPLQIPCFTSTSPYYTTNLPLRSSSASWTPYILFLLTI